MTNAASYWRCLRAVCKRACSSSYVSDHVQHIASSLHLTYSSADAGYPVRLGAREYRPTLDIPDYDVKLLKPQNILEMLHAGSRDIGFAGYDWVKNLDVDVIELLDLELDPVQIVAAAPRDDILATAKQSKKCIRIASEYEQLTKDWIRERDLNAQFIRTFGATESFPPEDADMIVDNSATGSTLKANGLKIVDVVLRSSTRLYASKAAYSDPRKRSRIDDFVMMLKAVLEARKRVLVAFNVSKENLETILADAPCMTAPSVSQLYHSEGFAVQVAALRDEVMTFVLKLKDMGATDIIISKVCQIVA